MNEPIHPNRVTPTGPDHITGVAPREIQFPVTLQGWVTVRMTVDEEFPIVAIDINREFPTLRPDAADAFEVIANESVDLELDEANSIWDKTRPIHPATIDKIEVEGIPFFDSEEVETWD